MTPAQLTTTMRAIFGEYKPCISSSELHQVLARVLGDEAPVMSLEQINEQFKRDYRSMVPAAPPSAPLREPATMVAKDRAAEMGEDWLHLPDKASKGLIFGRYGSHAVCFVESAKYIDLARAILADALRAYGDELLEKACEKVAKGWDCGRKSTLVSTLMAIRSSQSTPPKDNR